MKKDIHPKTNMVIFHDNSSGEDFLVESTIKTNKKGKYKDGKEYPLYEIEISSASHPFFTGKQTVLDTAGRVQKFQEKAKKAEKNLVSKKAKKAEKREVKKAKKEKGKK